MKKLLFLLVATALLSSSASGAVSSKKNKKTKPATQTQELSRKQAEEIAEKYIKAILDRDYLAWSSLMVDTKRVTEKEFMEYYLEPKGRWRPFGRNFKGIKKIKVRKVRGNSVILDVYQDFGDGVGIHPDALLLLPDGEIKYDALIVRHPLLIARSSAGRLSYLHNYSLHPTKMYLMNDPEAALFKSGVPLFGYDEPNASRYEKLRSLDEIIEWIFENKDEWDSSEPNVYLPKEIVQGLPYLN